MIFLLFVCLFLLVYARLGQSWKLTVRVHLYFAYVYCKMKKCAIAKLIFYQVKWFPIYFTFYIVRATFKMHSLMYTMTTRRTTSITTAQCIMQCMVQTISKFVYFWFLSLYFGYHFEYTLINFNLFLNTLSKMSLENL